MSQSDYPQEEIYQIEWHGPCFLSDLEEEDEEYLKSVSLYAKYEDHPVYGRQVLTYIGKVISEQRTVLDRLKDKDHDVGHEQIYTGTIYKFTDWKNAEKTNYESDKYIRYGEGHQAVISRIEELLIYALWPAGNIRNKNSASESWAFRLFNTGYIGSLPPEVSGHYALYNAPNTNKMPKS